MGLEAVKEEIIMHSKGQANSLIAEARKEANKIMKETEKKIEEMKEKSEAETKRILDTIKRQESTSAEMENKKMLLEAKKEIIDLVMSKAKNKLEKLPLDEKRIILENLLKKAQKEIKVKYVYCNKNDIQLVNKLCNFPISNSEISGGLILENEDRTVRINLSYESLLDKIKEENLIKIRDILFQDILGKESYDRGTKSTNKPVYSKNKKSYKNLKVNVPNK